MVNDFVLKSMDEKSATININNFVYVLLCGYMERNFSVTGGSR